VAERRHTVLIALADRPRAEELAAYLAEHEAMLAILADEVEANDLAGRRFDAVVSDNAPIGRPEPAVLLSDGARTAAGRGTIRATLRANAADPLIAAAVRLAAAGYSVVPDPERVFDSKAGHDPMPVSAISLTQREREVIALLAEGASNKLIARRLDISVHTAKFHVAAILEKLGAVNRTDAIAIAMREGLVLV